MAATAEITVIVKAIAPTVSGTWVEPGGATDANRAGSSAVMGSDILRDRHHRDACTGLKELGVEAWEYGVVALVDDAPHQQRHCDRERYAMDADSVEIGKREHSR